MIPPIITIFRRYLAHILKLLSDRRTKVRAELEAVYRRDVLGATGVTAALMKMIEKTLNGEWTLLVLWTVVFLVWNWAFVNWERLSENVDKSIDSAADTTDPD